MAWNVAVIGAGATFIAALAGCGSGPVVEAATPQPVYYTALGDSITAGSDATAPAGDFVSLVGGALNAATVTNLGVGGETAAPFDFTAGTVPLSYPGLLAAEVAQIPSNTNLVTLYIGTNDIKLCTELVDEGFDTTAAFSAYTANYAQALAGIIAGIKAIVPRAKIVVLTVPNPAYRTAAGEAAPMKRDITNMDRAMRQDMIATGDLVTDLACDPQMYDNANFAGPNDVHPVESGHAEIAADVLATLRGTKSAATCTYVQANF